MVSMDSANSHLAAMQGVKTITLWGITHPFAGFVPFNQPIEHILLPDLDKYPNIKAFVSLDGSDVFYFGDTEEDDAFLSEIYKANLMHPEKTNAAYFYLESGNKWDEFTPTDEYHYFKKINSLKRYLRITNSLHEDFGSLAWALKVSKKRTEIYEDITKGTLSFFRQYLKQETGFIKQYEQLLKKTNITNKTYELKTKTLIESIELSLKTPDLEGGLDGLE